MYLKGNFIGFAVGLICTIQREFEPTISDEVLNQGLLARALRKLTGLSNEFDLRAEGEELVFYQRVNGKIESFRVDTIGNSHITEPEQGAYIVALKKDKAIKLLSRELIAGRLGRFLRRDELLKEYLSASIRTAKRSLRNISQKSNKTRVTLNNDISGRIQYLPNPGNQCAKIEFSDHCILSARISPSKSDGKDHDSSHIKNQRVLIFYLDNISKQTADIIGKDHIRFPTLSRLLSESTPIGPEISISNWTLPAAISILAGQHFSRHKTFNNILKPSFLINMLLYSSAATNRVRNKLEARFGSIFYAGTNWRLKQEHGLHSFFRHAMSSPFYGDAYDLLGLAIKQLDIAGGNSSFHWMSFMDSHHPVQGSILPMGAHEFIRTKSLREGYSYATGPKNYTSKKDTTQDIYFAQIKTIDSHINTILNKSYESVPKANHIIFLISDHGTSFLNSENLECELREKHSSILRVHTTDDAYKHYLAQYKCRKPDQLLEFISDILELKHPSCEGGKPYSEVMYPGANYQFLYFSSDCIYRYTSLGKVPRSNGSSKNVIQALKKVISDGTWEHIRGDCASSISNRDLPDNVRICFDSVKDEWIMN